MEQWIDAGVDSFFSKFDNAGEEEINTSDSSSDTKDISFNESGKTEEKKDVKDDSGKTEESKKEESAKTEEEKDKDTPFHEHKRWKQKLENERKLKADNKSLNSKYDELLKENESLKHKPLTDEQLNDMTPQQIMDHTKAQMEKEFSNKQELSKQSTEEAEKYIDESLEALKDAWHEFDENKLLKYAEEYTEWNIEKAYELYQKFDAAKDKGADEEAKMTEKKKQAEANSSNKWKSWTASWYKQWTSWDNLNLK